MPITVCHYPPGTSKWNKIEHRLFSFISLNWQGRPLVNYETVVNLIGATKTRTGLHVKAVLDTGTYEKGLKIEDEAMRNLRLRPRTDRRESDRRREGRAGRRGRGRGVKASQKSKVKS